MGHGEPSNSGLGVEDLTVGKKILGLHGGKRPGAKPLEFPALYSWAEPALMGGRGTRGGG